jgi:hypothetical protein
MMPGSDTVAAFTTELFNTTPLDLEVWSQGAALAELPSYGRVSRAWPSTDLEVRTKSVPKALAVVRPNAQNPQIVLGPDRVRSLDGGGSVSATFVNGTSIYVDIFWVDYQGAEQRYCAALPPGERFGQRSYGYHAWAVRSTFTGELLAMYVLGTEATQTVTIAGEIVARAAKSLPIPSPLPPIEKVALVGETRERPRPESRDYIVVAEHDNLEKAQFNTRTNVATRTVRISGARLIWDRLDDHYGLMSYQGAGVLDLEALEIYADHVVIASPLRFPGTRITIYARELEFRGDGAIDTTPIAYTTRARSAKRTNDGHPADDKGEPTYKAANGRPGEPGGDILLFARKLTLPRGGEARKRFIAQGSPGQEAEPGGVQRYKPKRTDQPTASEGKDLPHVRSDAVANMMDSSFVSNKKPYDWRWPGNVDWPHDVKWDGKALILDNGGKVVHLTMVAHDDSAASNDTNVFYFPPGARHQTFMVWDNAALANVRNHGIPATTRRRPGDGEDAYPGGQPGNGGSGGKIVTSLPPAVVQPLCDTTGGRPGPDMPAVNGKERGGPYPAYWLQIDIVKHAWIESKRSPEITSIENVSASNGANAPARRGVAGATPQVTGDAKSWIHPDGLDAVLACARDAYRNGHRELTRNLLEPYYAELRDGNASDELQARFVSLQVMRANLLENLDYYGNPPGWLPRLRLSTNFKIFERVRQLSATLLYYGLTAEQRYDRLEHTNDLARQTSAALGQEMQYCVESLRAAYTDLAQSRVDLADVSRQVNLMQGELKALKDLTEQEALTVAERQRIFRGICKTVAGAMKVVPVGQPYLGLAGDVAGHVGDIDFTNPDAIPQQIGKALGKVGGTTDTFLKDNADLLIEDKVKDLKDKLKLDKSNIKDLGEQLDRAKSANDNLEKSIEEKTTQVETEWTSERAGEVEALEAMLTKLDETITTLSNKSESQLTQEQRQQRQAAREAQARLRKAVGITKATDLTRQRASLARQLEEVKRAIEIEGDEAKTRNESVRALLDDERKLLEGFKTKVDGLEQRQRTAKQSQTDHKEAIETKEEEMKQTLSRLKGVGSGITMIGEGVATLGTPLTTEDTEVKTLAASLLKTKHDKKYQEGLGKLQALGRKQAEAMAQLSQAQHQISAQVARITENLTTQNALSRQRQALDGVLDIRSKRYLRGMQDRARDMLRWSVYNLVMSFRYEFLRDMSDSFYNFDKIVEALRKLETVSPTGDKRVLTPAQFNDVEDTVVLSELLAEARKILEERQHKAAPSNQNETVRPLSKEQCEELRQTGRVTFNLVRDLQAGSFNYIDARIVDIDLVKLGVATTDAQLSLRLVFRHSGESVILGRDQRTNQWTYYYFRAAPTDDPIEWGFSYNRAYDDDKQKRIQKDQRIPVRDDLINQILAGTDKQGGTPIKFQEYLPSYFSDITLFVTRGDSWDSTDISEISDLQIKVTYALSTERRT